MFKIGEFSKLSRVSVKALRLYDELGLLPPAEVDRWTGYRYYSAAQLPRLHRILALKDLGFSLDEVHALVDEELSAAEMRGVLKAKYAEVATRAREADERLAAVEARLRLLEKEDAMSDYEVVLKEIPAVRVAAIRDLIPSYPTQGHLWDELMGHIHRHGVKWGAAPCFTLYHDECYKEKDVDAEVAEPIAGPCPETARVKVREVAGGLMACAVHKGPYDGLNGAYEAIMQWAEANGYRSVGADRDVYLVGPADTKDPAEYVTEVQEPVAKK